MQKQLSLLWYIQYEVSPNDTNFLINTCDTYKCHNRYKYNIGLNAILHLPVTIPKEILVKLGVKEKDLVGFY